MGFGTFVIGCLPTYQRVGVITPLALVTLRLLQGIGMGASGVVPYSWWSRTFQATGAAFMEPLFSLGCHLV
jgi:MFS family permease